MQLEIDVLKLLNCVEHGRADVQVLVSEVEQEVVVDAHQVVMDAVDVPFFALVQFAEHHECIFVLAFLRVVLQS